MYEAARDAGVVHMTAFTYRFAPSMRYLRHLLKSGGARQPRHFRSQRFLDWPETSWGWRQYKDKAGAGDLYDMTIHRIDFALDLLGPDRPGLRRRRPVRPADQDARRQALPALGRRRLVEPDRRVRQSGATGVWEGTTLAKGYGRDGFGHEWAEINGSEGSAVYRLHEPNTILLGKTGQDLAPVAVPDEFLKPAGSPRDPRRGQAGDRLPLRPDVGVRLGDRRGPPGRPQLLRRPERPDHRRRRARIARQADLGRHAAGGRLAAHAPVRDGIPEGPLSERPIVNRELAA